MRLTSVPSPTHWPTLLHEALFLPPQPALVPRPQVQVKRSETVRSVCPVAPVSPHPAGHLISKQYCTRTMATTVQVRRFVLRYFPSCLFETMMLLHLAGVVAELAFLPSEPKGRGTRPRFHCQPPHIGEKQSLGLTKGANQQQASGSLSSLVICVA
jgi:hypothetical protein